MDAITYTCFGCFAEVTSSPPSAGHVVNCPSCGAILAAGPNPEAPPATDFGVTDEDRRGMTRGHVAEAFAAEAASNALLRGVFRGIT